MTSDPVWDAVRMDVKHQVFVSSTYVDLVDERREVMQALLELDCIPAGMEMFPAANEEQWDLIKSVIDTSDYYVVVVGGRYGSVTAEGVSYTEKEYDYAVAQGIPIAGFVHAAPGDIPASKSELDSKAVERLDAFREKVRSRPIKTFTDPASLGGVVSRSLVSLIRKNPRPGWVRGENAMSDAVRAEILELRAMLAESERESLIAATDDIVLDQDLAQGRDEFTFRYVLEDTGWNGQGYEWTGDEQVTWDAAFSAIGPGMLDEAVDHALRSRFENWALTVVDLPRAGVRREDLQLTLDRGDWDSIIIQLRALGLIEMGVKKRAIADRATYWRLTPTGDRYLVKLRAARRMDAPSGATVG